MSWKDHMPAIPLASSVAIYRGSFDSSTGGQWDNARLQRLVDDGWRVDLSDPQGFGYALRFASWAKGSIVYRWLRDETTDADRDWVAKACAEVAQ